MISLSHPADSCCRSDPVDIAQEPVATWRSERPWSMLGICWINPSHIFPPFLDIFYKKIGESFFFGPYEFPINPSFFVAMVSWIDTRPLLTHPALKRAGSCAARSRRETKRTRTPRRSQPSEQFSTGENPSELSFQSFRKQSFYLDL